MGSGPGAMRVPTGSRVRISVWTPCELLSLESTKYFLTVSTNRTAVVMHEF